MTDINLDRAAKIAGYDDWKHVGRDCGSWGRDMIESLAYTLDELDAAKAELEAFKQEVSEAVEDTLTTLAAHGHCAEVSAHDTLSRFIIAKPDPLVEVWLEAFPGNHIDDAREECAKISAALAKHGLKLERID